MTDLLNVDIARQQILEHIQTLSQEEVPLLNALGRILATDIVAGINLPPFANSTMDGYAVRSQDCQQSPTTLRVTMDIPAGTSSTKTLKVGEAARIMTGAPIPDGADAVIRVEDTDNDWSKWSAETLPEQVTLYESVPAGNNVHPSGENIQKGQKVLKTGTPIRPQEIGILAALGFATLLVYRKPKIAIISSGDELIDIQETPAPGQIRDVNSYTLAALVQQLGGIPIRLPIARDTLASVREIFQAAVDQKPDMIISSAGVSVGTADLINNILEEMGEIRFWRINLKPGKPLAFGHIQKIPFFGLPGNPVSVMVTFDVLVRPALSKMMGQGYQPILQEAILEEDLDSRGTRRHYVRVQLRRDGNQLFARATGTQSSGALMSMVLADGFLIIPEGGGNVQAGMAFPVQLLRPV